MLAGKDRVAVSVVHAGEPPGGERQLALGGLPAYAPAVGVDALVVGREQALLLVVLEEVGPQQRDRRREGRRAEGEPVEPHAEGKHHREEDAQDDRRAPEVGGDHHDDAENAEKVRAHHDNGRDVVDVPVLLEVGHLLGADDDVDDLDNLRGLDADTGEADPALVAGVVLNAEDIERDHEQPVEHEQQLPLFAEQVGVDDRKYHKGDHAEHEGEKLHDHQLERLHVRPGVRHADRRAVHHRRTEKRADQTDHKQKDVRALEKLPDIGLYPTDNRKAPRLCQNCLGKTNVSYHKKSLYATAGGVV